MNGPALVSGQMRYILVVESDWKERFTLSMLLQRFGYTVVEAYSFPYERPVSGLRNRTICIARAVGGDTTAA